MRQHRITPLMSRRASRRSATGVPFQEKWSNAKAAQIGYMVGKAMPVKRIASALDDDTTPASIRKMVKVWGLPKFSGESRVREPIMVPLHSTLRDMLYQIAESRGETPEVTAALILKFAIRDNMVDNIIDDRRADV